MPAMLKLGERLGGNNDIASLKRELNALRGYRDVLHDTMKALVPQAQGKLKLEETPELAANLALVAAQLDRLGADAASDAARAAALAANELDELRAEAERQRLRAEQAENQVAHDAGLKDDGASSSTMAKMLLSAEQQRNAALLEASEQEFARYAAGLAIEALENEAAAMDAALVRLAARSEVEWRSARLEGEAAATRDASAAAALSELLAANEQLRGQVAEASAVAADASAKLVAAEAELKKNALVQARALRNDVEFEEALEAMREAQSQAAAERRRASELRADRDYWKLEAARATADIEALREQLRGLELSRQPEPAPKSQFAQYMTALTDSKAGSKAGRPRGHVESGTSRDCSPCSPFPHAMLEGGSGSNGSQSARAVFAPSAAAAPAAALRLSARERGPLLPRRPPGLNVT
mmetsp:Transcript_5651/g.14981  ORF Transcript_5651/g.14981 Transcript_5651/m.14981 type:complete len:415 (-) Transcript_5651:100-1344(-)